MNTGDDPHPASQRWRHCYALVEQTEMAARHGAAEVRERARELADGLDRLLEELRSQQD